MTFARLTPADDAFRYLSPDKQLLGYLYDHEAMSGIWKYLGDKLSASEWNTRRSAIEDILQDVWLSLWKGVAAGRITYMTYTLLKATVDNVLIDRRRKKKHVHRFVEWDDSHSCTECDEDRRIAELDVDTLISRLNPRRAQIARMFNVEQFTLQEIAVELNLSLKTIQREVAAANIEMAAMVQ
jgi:RNA polymerase sigma factor (sigma-70 family)